MSFHGYSQPNHQPESAIAAPSVYLEIVVQSEYVAGVVAMTEQEFCESAGLSKHQVHTWLESGLLEAKMVNGQDGPSQEFDASQLQRARLLKTLLAKGVSLARLSGVDLAVRGENQRISRKNISS
jgi:hypothetical protein